MSKNLKVTLCQLNLFWEDAKTNREEIEKSLSNTSDTDIIVLPEMFTTAFTMNVKKVAETMSGESLEWMLRLAKEKNTAVCGSIIIEENSKFFNRFIFATPCGEISYYDKRHLFRMAEEEKYFSAGKKQLIIGYKGWKIMPQICYDLRFPVWSRRTATLNYDLLLYVANWPSPRAKAWSKLLMARAIENQCYVVGVNRVGQDKKGLKYIGGTNLIDAKGEVLFEAKPNTISINTMSIGKENLEAFRQKFPVEKDGDDFAIN